MGTTREHRSAEHKPEITKGICGLVSTAILSLMLARDPFFFAPIFTSTYNARTDPAPLSGFAGRYVMDYRAIAVGGARRFGP